MDFQRLGDIDNRGICPKCKGFGFYHSSMEKHDKPSTIRCKKCQFCTTCEGSGITFGVEACKTCSALGFVHLDTKKHKALATIRCYDCIDCYECFGKGVVDPKQKKQKQKKPF